MEGRIDHLMSTSAPGGRDTHYKLVDRSSDVGFGPWSGCADGCYGMALLMSWLLARMKFLRTITQTSAAKSRMKPIPFHEETLSSLKSHYLRA